MQTEDVLQITLTHYKVTQYNLITMYVTLQSKILCFTQIRQGTINFLICYFCR